MHISKIELENIKSHVSSTFEFSRGTTAITGENGAGKTSIIEAIAWVLFDLLEYKKEEFVRRGAKKGIVRVTFESGLDERDYVVTRDTGTAYHVTDPRLQTKIADKKEEVFRFLWQHLGLEPGTDLRSLFRQAIGVPQGTFTAIFLEGATERKTAFDRLLKVEEYRQAAEKLRETTRYLDAGITTVRENVAHAEGELSRSDLVEDEHKDISARTKALAADVVSLADETAKMSDSVGKLDAVERSLVEMRSNRDRLLSESEKAELVVRQSEDGLKQATDAADAVKAVEKDAARHSEALGHLKELERERIVRDGLRDQIAGTETGIANVAAEKKRIGEDISSVQRSHAELESLRPMAVEQDALDHAISALRDRVAAGRAASANLKSVEDKLLRLRAGYKANQEQIRDAATRSEAAAGLASLETRDAELSQSIAGLRASLERDEKFQNEIRNGLCPILSQKCLNLKPGETLESFVSSQFTEIRSQISTLESERSAVTSDLRIARDATKFAAALETLRTREQEITEEGTRLSAEKTEIDDQIAGLADAERGLAAAASKLAALDDPRARIRLLEKDVARETELRDRLTDTESNLERLENDRRILVEQLEAYTELDQRLGSLSAERDATLEAYRRFLSNETMAKTVDERSSALKAAAANFGKLAEQLRLANAELEAAAAGYDGRRHEAERAALREAENRHSAVKAQLEAAEERLARLAGELARFSEIRKSLAAEFKEKERLEKIAEATAFIRDTLKEAAPRVARNYVYHVSLEANLLFREITGNAERTLKWGEDYAIILEEDGFERPFQSLSGGEQMAAALAVRLALLKQLTDIRIAFFDEPTTNMDAERRENLAMQISRITNFDQLFVISHDETFDSFVDNVVSVGV